MIVHLFHLICQILIYLNKNFKDVKVLIYLSKYLRAIAKICNVDGKEVILEGYLQKFIDFLNKFQKQSKKGIIVTFILHFII